MNKDTKSLIHERAATLFPLLRQILMDANTSDYALEEAFRFCFLILKKPQGFLEAFRHGMLKIDETLVFDAYHGFRFDLPGPVGIMAEEREIIQLHNEEVNKLTSNYPGLRTNVIGLQQRRDRLG